jgi:hypothetical protein
LHHQGHHIDARLKSVLRLQTAVRGLLVFLTDGVAHYLLRQMMTTHIIIESNLAT